MAWAAAAVVSSFRPPTLSLPHSNLRRNYSVRRVQAPRFRVGVGAAPRFRVGVVAAQQTDIFKVLGTIWKTSKDVLDTGSKLVPESVPRPVARVGVAIGGFVAMLFILKSVLSTALFILAVMGLIYFVFIYWNKDEAPRRSTKEEDGSIDESLEEARRIMEKYK